MHQSATPHEIRTAHAALARTDTTESRFWHLAEATTGPDEDVAARLERAADDAGRRRAPASQSGSLRRAARLSPMPDQACRRFLGAARAAAAAGLAGQALGLIDEAEAAMPSGELRAAMQHLRGICLLWSGHVDEAARVLTDGAARVASSDPIAAAEMLVGAATAYTALNRYDVAEALSERAAMTVDIAGDDAARAYVLAILGWVRSLRGRTEAAVAALDESTRLSVELDPVSSRGEWLSFVLRSQIPIGRLDQARDQANALSELARDAGALATLSGALVVRPDAAYRLAQWRVTETATREAIDVCSATGQRIWLGHALALRSRRAAAQGAVTESERAAAEALAIAEADGIRAGQRFGRAALGFLCLGQERVKDAVEHLETVQGIVAGSGLEESTLVPWIPDLIEAYQRIGRVRDAQRLLETLERQAGGGPATARAPLARCQGLVRPDFDVTFVASLALDDETPQPFERARTLLAYGRRLRRAGRRVAARRRLKEAHGLFREMGAQPWANQAGAELAAAGGSAPGSAGRSTGPMLTPGEKRVAVAVMRGGSTREIATTLFVSPKTVETHLTHIYRKLGVSSRAALVAELIRPDDGDT